MSKSKPVPVNITSRFGHRLLDWFDRHGRTSLPWQQNRDPYRVWISEIMLQQTQVAAVIPYFERFINRFPAVDILAAADTDTVMHHWSGLGYYARARNLHKAAKQIVERHGAVFPQHIDELVALPGIGRSTAGAILAFCFNQRLPILDGNVKRVLTRYFAIEGYPGTKSVENRLWQLAEQLTPEARIADYTQAIMDLGATLCKRSNPDCHHCPLAADCTGLRQGNPTAYPQRKPPRDKPQKSLVLLLLQRTGGELLLEKRPPSGIWGGLWSLPEMQPDDDSRRAVRERFAMEPIEVSDLPALRHGFTHFDLLIQPRLIAVSPPSSRIMDGENYLWYNPGHPEAIGLPAAVARLLRQFTQVEASVR